MLSVLDTHFYITISQLLSIRSDGMIALSKYQEGSIVKVCENRVFVALAFLIFFDLGDGFVLLIVHIFS